ncbi:MAG TPA: DUF4112 domain-containing protein [Vicinamibacterales bacterium]|nr:DUF4112 domain-containing protein [Vicinamibacterales bacterium]
MHSVIETLAWILAIGAVVALAAYWVLRLLAARIAHHVALIAERQVTAALAPGVSKVPRAFTRPPVVNDELRARRLAELDKLAWLMDGIIPLPIIGGVGLDAVLGLFPVAGDVASLMISSVLIVRAAQLGAPPRLISRLIAIQVIDLLIGLVPVIGDLADAGYHANERSVALIREWMRDGPA